MTKLYFKHIFSFLVFYFVTISCFAQYKEYKLNPNGDTINIINKEGKKIGKWVVEMPELRGEPGYVEEGIYLNGLKEGFFRRYTIQGDLLAVENYFQGGKEGLQQYFTFMGNLEHEEYWRAYNPDHPYDTIAIYGDGNNEINSFKVVKAETYSVKDGDWKYYEPETGRVIRVEKWDRNLLVKPESAKAVTTAPAKPKKVEKTAEMLEWEKKNSGKKGGFRDGGTHL